MAEKLISKEQTWKGLRMELSSEELQSIFQQEYEPDKYYDYNLLLSGIKKALNKEIDFEYYIDWCILIANCFNYTNYETKALNTLMWDIGYFFDGCSFEDGYSEKELYQDIAFLKSYNHEYENKVNRKRKPFETNGVERILTFDHANWTLDSRVMRVIVKDNINKQFDLKYVDEGEFDYDENVNYTFVDDKKFENIFNSFYDEKAGWEENHNLKF
ncbi:MAG: hypothetical protein IKJ33_02940 [Clostridia bacterium]|nr:hypothetical protein [Clostridia bacterium]